MAVIRQQNWLNQQRVDVPHARAIESGVAADFDVLAGDMIAGNEALVVKGFKVTTLTAGIPATSITIRVAGSTLLHPEATESGSIFRVPADRADEILSSSNERVSGSFTAGTTNYVGIDLQRSADASTKDLVKFLDPTTKAEKAKSVPLARTLDYVIVVSTQDFGLTPGIAPVAKVVTDASNNVVSVQDARTLFGRLGKGGGVPDSQYYYSWPGGRTEPGDNSDFDSGDKKIESLKSWMDATVTRLWELGGGEYWFSATADRNVRMIRLGSATVFPSTGDWFEWTGGHLHWRGLAVIFDNSTGYVNEIKDQATNSAGLTDLADGECVYVDLDRTQNLSGVDALVATKTAMTTLGAPTTPGSRYIFAWRYGSYIYTRDGQFFVGVTVPVATTLAVGTVKLNQAAGTPATPVVPAIGADGSIVISETDGVNNPAINGYGLDSAVVAGGAGIRGVGGDYTGAGVVAGGRGGFFLGGKSSLGTAGVGIISTGGDATETGGVPNLGGDFYGGVMSPGKTGAGASGSRSTGGTGSTGAAQGHGAINQGASNAGGAGQAGHGTTSTGGSNTTGPAGHGVLATGGAATTGAAGHGGASTGGNATTGAPGNGWNATGGTATSGNTVGGKGASIIGGTSNGSAAGAEGARVRGGQGGTNGKGGLGAYIYGGDAGGGNNDAGTGLEVHCGSAAGSGSAGTAVDVYSGADGLLVRQATGANVKIRTSQSNTGSAGILVQDASLNTRNYLSRLGFWTTKVSKFTENWLMLDMGDQNDYVGESGSPNTKYASQLIWAVSKGDAGTTDHTIGEPSASFLDSYLIFNTTGSLDPADASRISTLRRFVPPPASDDLVLEMEFSVSMAAVANTDVVYIGLTSDTGNWDSNATTVAFRYYGNGAAGGVDTTTNWYCLTRKGNGAAHAAPGSSANSTVTDSGVAISTASEPTQRMRIEIMGANYAGSDTVKFYINEALVATHTTDIGTSPMYVFARSARELVVAASARLRLGPIGLQWSRQLNFGV